MCRCSGCGVGYWIKAKHRNEKNDGSIRDATFLEFQLVDSTLKEGEVSDLCVCVMVLIAKIICLLFFIQVPVTFGGPAGKDVRRHPAGSAIKLKGAVVVNREGRFCLKATGVTDIEVCLFSQI